MNTSIDIGVSTKSNVTMNEDTPVGVAYAVKEGVTPSVVDMMGEMEKQNALDHNSVLEYFPPLSKPVTTDAGNAPGNSSYANVTGIPSRKKLNIRTLFTLGDNAIDVAVPVKLHSVPVTAFNDDGLSAIATNLDTPIMLDSYTADMYTKSWGRSSYARVMTELHAGVELKDNIVIAMPRIKEVGYYTCNIRVNYELKPSMCACCKVFGYLHEECTKNISASTTKTLKKTSQTPKGFSIRQKIRFKPKQVFQPVFKKSTANTHGKMNNPESTKEVSKSNPFEVLTSVDNDVDLGTNRGIANSADKGTNNVSSSYTPICEKNDKIERQIYEGKLRFVDDDGNPFFPTGIVESDSEVEVVFDETANLRILTSGKDESDKGYGTNSLLEQ
nr:hypothetical protein [Tanacetum cinerariifolium]